jgi:hypothetical protein
MQPNFGTKIHLKYALCALCNDVEFVEMQKFLK